MVVLRPFDKLHLGDENRLEPSAVGHLRLRQPLPPAAAAGLGQVREWTIGDFERREFPEETVAHRWREAVARPRDVDQTLALVIAEDQRVERSCADRVAANHELL